MTAVTGHRKTPGHGVQPGGGCRRDLPLLVRTCASARSAELRSGWQSASPRLRLLSADAVLADRRLAALRPLVTGRLLDVPDPRLVVLQPTSALFRAVWIRVVDPP